MAPIERHLAMRTRLNGLSGALTGIDDDLAERAADLADEIYSGEADLLHRVHDLLGAARNVYSLDREASLGRAIAELQTGLLASESD